VEDLQITLTPVLPLNFANPEIQVRYCNASANNDLSISPPVNENRGPPGDYCRLAVAINGKPVSVNKAGEFGDAASPPACVLRPGACKELRFRLSDVCKVPDEWKRIEIALETCWGSPANVGSKLLMIRREDSSLQTSVQVELPLDPVAPRIVTRYSNGSDKQSFRLFFPIRPWVTHYRDISAFVDDIAPPWSQGGEKGTLAPGIPLASQIVGPGESVEFHARLDFIFKLPPKWRTLLLHPVGNAEIKPGLICISTIERKGQ
jgi:hypothetical protein